MNETNLDELRIGEARNMNKVKSVASRCPGCVQVEWHRVGCLCEVTVAEGLSAFAVAPPGLRGRNTQPTNLVGRALQDGEDRRGAARERPDWLRARYVGQWRRHCRARRPRGCVQVEWHRVGCLCEVTLAEGLSGFAVASPGLRGSNTQPMNLVGRALQDGEDRRGAARERPDWLRARYVGQWRRHWRARRPRAPRRPPQFPAEGDVHR
jgi:hypothetical protein